MQASPRVSVLSYSWASTSVLLTVDWALWRGQKLQSFPLTLKGRQMVMGVGLIWRTFFPVHLWCWNASLHGLQLVSLQLEGSHGDIATLQNSLMTAFQSTYSPVFYCTSWNRKDFTLATGHNCCEILHTCFRLHLQVCTIVWLCPTKGSGS